MACTIFTVGAAIGGLLLGFSEGVRWERRKHKIRHVVRPPFQFDDD